MNPVMGQKQGNSTRICHLKRPEIVFIILAREIKQLPQPGTVR
jgi:hypothetical protein